MPAVPTSMTRTAVCGLQKALAEKTRTDITIDGQFGNKSIACLKSFQIAQGLTPTGIYDALSQAILEPFIKAKYLVDEDYSRAATALMVEIPAIKAVITVESKASGFFFDGQCAILFERHKFFDALAKKKPAAELARLAAQHPGLININAGGYIGGRPEWDRLNKATTIDREAAFLSASYGMFQIMGFNHEYAGFEGKGVEAFVQAMQVSERNQLDAFIAFLKHKSNAKMLVALRNKDWAGFAEKYNGKNYAINKYDTKLAAAYKNPF